MEAVLKDFRKTIKQLETKMKAVIDNIPEEHAEKASELRAKINSSMQTIKSGDVSAINKIIQDADTNTK